MQQGWCSDDIDLAQGIMEGDLSEENFPFVKPPAAPAGGAAGTTPQRLKQFFNGGAGKRSTAKSRKTINNKESTWASKRKGKEVFFVLPYIVVLLYV